MDYIGCYCRDLGLMLTLCSGYFKFHFVLTTRLDIYPKGTCSVEVQLDNRRSVGCSKYEGLSIQFLESRKRGGDGAAVSIRSYLTLSTTNLDRLPS